MYFCCRSQLSVVIEDCFADVIENIGTISLRTSQEEEEAAIAALEEEEETGGMREFHSDEIDEDDDLQLDEEGGAMAYMNAIKAAENALGEEEEEGHGPSLNALQRLEYEEEDKEGLNLKALLKRTELEVKQFLEECCAGRTNEARTPRPNSSPSDLLGPLASTLLAPRRFSVLLFNILHWVIKITPQPMWCEYSVLEGLEASFQKLSHHLRSLAADSGPLFLNVFEKSNGAPQRSEVLLRILATARLIQQATLPPMESLLHERFGLYERGTDRAVLPLAELEQEMTELYLHTQTSRVSQITATAWLQPVLSDQVFRRKYVPDVTPAAYLVQVRIYLRQEGERKNEGLVWGERDGREEVSGELCFGRVQRMRSSWPCSP